jgi:UDP-glucuronate 4-epimerase
MKKRQKKNFLVTGAAGFIGYHLCSYLLKKGYAVIGLDNLNSYYSKKLKIDRIKELVDLNKNFKFHKIDLKNKNQIQKLFNIYKFEKVLHMAAQAGVRKSIKYPMSYVNNNIVATTNLFEVIKDYEKIPVILASSSSVYGDQSENVYSTKLRTDTPIQMYAVSKKCTELMGHSYNYQYNIPVVALRFFTVYGPWGRPDMALFDFTKKIIKNKTINVYNNGNHYRDFTFIDDIIKKIILVCDKTKFYKNPKKQNKYKVYNIGNGKPFKLMKFIKLIEEELKIKAKIKYLPTQPGDMLGTHAEMKEFNKDFKKLENYSLKDGIKEFINWYKKYYMLNE